MSRRRFLALALTTAGAAAVGGSCLGQRRNPVPDPAATTMETLRLGPITVRAVRTGSVAVKRAHRELAGPAATRLAAIALDPRWTPFLPITCWLIEHPEGAILVDTGETARVAEPGYFACDAGTRLFYERFLRFDVPAATQVGPQLRRLGLPVEEVRTVVLTHLHSDHAGGLGHFPHATFLLSRVEVEQPPAGALRCRWPGRFRPTSVVHAPEPFGAFSHSTPLTVDGAVRLVPTPGHTRGHQSVLLRHEDRWLLLAGDASFDEEQVRRGRVAGICEDVGAARRTLAVVREQLAGYPTIYLPTHDPGGTARLAAGTITAV